VVIVCVLLNSASCHLLIKCKELLRVTRPELLKGDKDTRRRVPAETASNMESGGSGESQPGAAEPPSRDTYAQLAYATLGGFGPVLVDISLCVTLFGAAALYQVSLSTLLETLWPQLSLRVYVLLCALALLPFIFVRDIAFLGSVSAVGVAAYIFSFLLIFIHGGMHNGLQLHWAQLLPVSDGGHMTVASVGGHVASGFGVVSFSLGVPILTFQLAESMRRPSKFLRTLDRTLGIVAAAYLLVGVLGVGLFASALAKQAENHRPLMAAGVQPMLLNNLPLHNWMGITTRLLVCVVLLLTSPLSLVPALEILETLLFGRSNSTAVAGVVNESTPLNTAHQPQVSVYGSAGAPSLERAVSEPAAIDTTQRPVQPPEPGPQSPTAENEPEYGTMTEQLLEALSPTPPPLTREQLRRQQQALRAIGAPKPHQRTGGSLRRTLLRLSVLVGVEVLTLLLRCFTLLMSLIGCVTLSLICYILPPMFYLSLKAQMQRQRARAAAVRATLQINQPDEAGAVEWARTAGTWTEVVGCAALLLFGLLSLSVGTAVVIQQGHCE